MSIVVFLGPSLAQREARWILDAEYLAPARAGDIHAVVARRPHAIALVDGLFEQVASVWHKEVLYALSEGIPVYGSSSMGALRAAELHAFGMIGVGRVFEAYRDGALEDDDEVALTHGPAPRYASMAEPMVNLREGLAEAARLGIVDDAQRALLVDASKARFYAERSWEAVFNDARRAGLSAETRDALTAFVARARPNVKRDDAIALLHTLARAREGLVLHRPTFVFEPTLLWKRMQRRASRAPEAAE
jgi:hypothetical protein